MGDVAGSAGPEPAPELRRGLKERHLQLIALGGIIGSGYFVGTAYVVGPCGPGAVVAYLLGGLLVYMVMVCLGELAAHIPVGGSFVGYASDFIHPVWGCGVGWSYWLTWVTFVPAEMIAAGTITHGFFPALPAWAWAVLFGGLITAINLLYVGAFGEAEFWLALVKIVAIVVFAVMAALILFGVIGTEGPLGTRVLLGEGGFLPNGLWAVMTTMVIVLVNFQGSEIIGIAAGESRDPARSIPHAVKAVSTRIILLYVVPVLLLVSIFPWRDVAPERSVFADALARHGFGGGAALFSVVVLTAAISSSNSGLYATSRAVYALSRQQMAPRWLSRLSGDGVPTNAVLISIGGCWLGILAFTVDTSGRLYETLLALSGFTGGLAWISICWSQLQFRRELHRLGHDARALSYRAPGFPWFTHVAIWLQVACLGGQAFNPRLRASMYVSVALLALPMVWYGVWGKALRTESAEERRRRVEQMVGRGRSLEPGAPQPPFPASPSPP
jgi:amino acid transporter, AAT family